MKLLASQGGFTLIEMVTILAVIAVLSGLVIANTQVGNRRQQLRDAAVGYVSAARNAESLASSSQAIPDPDQADQPAARKAYGVCITSSAIANTKCNAPSGAQVADTYQVYARDPDETSPVVADSITNPADQPEIIATSKLPKDYSFVLQTSPPNTPATVYLYLDYLPPAPSMFADGDSLDRTLTIKHKDVSLFQCFFGPKKADCQTIQVKPRSGVVYVR